MADPVGYIVVDADNQIHGDLSSLSEAQCLAADNIDDVNLIFGPYRVCAVIEIEGDAP